MQNTFFCEDDLTVDLLEAMETGSNTIFVDFDADATASQTLTVTAGTQVTTIAVTPSAHNNLAIPSAFWASGGNTTIKLTKGGTDAKTITITFPPELDTDAACFRKEGGTAQDYEIQGTWDIAQAISEISNTTTEVRTELTAVEIAAISVIIPTKTNTDPIADGANADVMLFSFSSDASVSLMPMQATLNFEVTTSGTLTLTITYTLDGDTIATQVQTYTASGYEILPLALMLQNIGNGDHDLTVNIAASGGGIS